MGNEKAKKRDFSLGNLLFYGGTALAIISIIGSALLWKHFDNKWIDSVTTYQYKSGTHVNAEVKYKESPAVGGDHNPKWMNCGFYPLPVPNEAAVHSLEHGAVWLTYRADLDMESVLKLASYTDTSSYILVSPIVDQKEDVIATAWNNQLVLEGVNDDRLLKFLNRFVQGPQTPEPGAPCIGGFGTPQ